MSKLKVGPGFIKITEEPVYVLDIREGMAAQKFPQLSGQVAVVRRPIAGEQGVRHDIDFFTVEEIESVEDNQNRKVSEMSELKARFNAQAEQPVGASDKLPLLD